MILIFGGTTEGRAAVKVVEEGGKPYLYSTLGGSQAVETPHGERLTGALTAEDAAALCRERGVRLLIDAAHPFAEGLHGTVAETAARCGLPVIRYERRHVRECGGVVRCADYADAVRKLEAAGVQRLLALTGVRTIPKLRAFWLSHDTWFRVLDRPESVAEAGGYGFPEEKLLFFHPGESETDLWRKVRPDAVLTKESGPTGYLPQKIEAARALRIPLYVVQRPPLPESFSTVYTEAGLRRRIEEFLPDWFPLRSGYTTGTCAVAAACAALGLLLSGNEPGAVSVVLPGGEEASLSVDRYGAGNGWAEATVTKRAGDDPDVTNGCRIKVRVALNGSGELRFLQGEGVGRVTLPGLGLPIGDPAVNPGPRKMMKRNFERMGVAGVDITISVENGAELALKTFNPKLGIEGGISIIGTTGIVRPFSNEAFVASIAREIDVAWAVGCRRLVINSGAKSERYLKREYPELPPQAFVHYGNFIGETLRAAVERGFRDLTMGIMIGKAVKLAEGHLDTHSRKVTMNRDFLKGLAAEAGCSAEASDRIDRMTLARELWQQLSADDLDRFAHRLLEACRSRCAPLLEEGRLEILLISEEGEKICRIR